MVRSEASKRINWNCVFCVPLRPEKWSVCGANDSSNCSCVSVWIIFREMIFLLLVLSLSTEQRTASYTLYKVVQYSTVQYSTAQYWIINCPVRKEILCLTLVLMEFASTDRKPVLYMMKGWALYMKLFQCMLTGLQLLFLLQGCDIYGRCWSKRSCCMGHGYWKGTRWYQG